VPSGRKLAAKETGAGGIGGATSVGAEAMGPGTGGRLGFGAVGPGVAGFGSVDAEVKVGVTAVVGGVDGGGSRLSGGGATAAMVGGSKGEEHDGQSRSWGFEHGEEALLVGRLKSWIRGSGQFPNNRPLSLWVVMNTELRPKKQRNRDYL
jgi:hypothetical protein